jgi:hypothetical protein
MDPEKKFKLDELPDEKSGSSVLKPQTPKKVPKINDPRIENLKPMNDQDRVDEMKRRWIFDRPVRLWGWLFFVGGLFILEQTRVHEKYLAEISSLNASTMDMGGTMIDSLLLNLDYFIKHPFFLAALTPLLFKFKKPSDFIFEVNFDGINTVKRINLGEHELPSRVQVKWNEIVGIQQTQIKHRPALVLMAPSGPVAELIWDISDENKRALKLLLKGLIPPTHALSQFLEKEVT